MGRKKKIKNILEKTEKELKEVIEAGIQPLELTKEQKEKKEKLKKIMNEQNRDAKKIVLKYASDELPVERIPFGLTFLDKMVGGGLPCKRFNVIWGAKGSGKTTLAYMAISQAQKVGKLCAFIDLERSFEASRAKQFGVNTEDLVLANVFSNAEQAMDSLISMCKNQVIDFIVLDSIQALSPLGEQETKKGKEKSIADDDMALLARKLSKFFRVSASGVYESGVSILLIGQARTNLGGFIAFDSLSGGHALSHWASFIINSRRGSKADAPTEKIDSGEVDEKGKKIIIEQQVGFNTVISLEKTKITSSMEGTKVHLPFLFQEGFLNESK